MFGKDANKSLSKGFVKNNPAFITGLVLAGLMIPAHHFAPTTK